MSAGTVLIGPTRPATTGAEGGGGSFFFVLRFAIGNPEYGNLPNFPDRSTGQSSPLAISKPTGGSGRSKGVMDIEVADTQIHQIPWMLTRCVEQVPGMVAVVTVGDDGLLTAASAGISRGRAEELAAVAAGLSSLSGGASRRFDMGTVGQVGISTRGGYLIVQTVNATDQLCVLTDRSADIGAVNYEMTVLAGKFAGLLVPEHRAALRTLLPLE